MKTPTERQFAVGCFALCVALNLAISSVGWSHSLRERHEFRQIQTALTAHYIQRDGWELAYPLPLFGPPWSAPFEFPFYQTAVAGLSSLTGLPLEQTGRLVALACLYLALPAFFLLQEFLPIPAPRRWLLPGLILLSPIYLYFSRTFMIESLALCAAAWFLLAFARALTRTGWTWPVAAAALGVVAALAKSTTLAIFLLAAGLFTLALLRRQPRPLAVLARAASLVLPALIAALAWTHYGDAVKATNPLSRALISSELRGFMFGPSHQRLDPKFWVEIASHTAPGVINSANAAFLILFGLVLGRQSRGWIGGLLFCFSAGPLIFANLYAVHDYYFYATGVFALAALALAWSNLLDLTVYPPAARYTVVGLSLALQIGGYAVTYWPTQAKATEATPELALVLRELTAPQDIVLILGLDWNPTVPYYADRRAIMVTDRMATEPARLEAVLKKLGPGRVNALVVAGALTQHPEFIWGLTQRLNLFPHPVVIGPDTQLYLRAALSDAEITNLERLPLKTFGPADGQDEALPVPRQRYPTGHIADRRVTLMMHPLPEEIVHPFGVSAHELAGRTVTDAHAPTDIIFNLPAGAREITVEFGILSGAWQNNPQPTAGVEFRVELRPADGKRRILFLRGLRPVETEGDRGTQAATIPIPPGVTGKLFFRTLPGPTGSIASAWAYWAKIDLH